MGKNNVTLEGPRGKLSLPIPHGVAVEHKGDQLLVTRNSDEKQKRANHGTVRALLKNMVAGVTSGHKKELEIRGIGFRVQAQGQKLTFNLGFSHPVEFDVPAGVKVSAPKLTQIILEGNDKEQVGAVAAKIRDLKRPEPYKGKGIRYEGEVVRTKQGKSVTK